MKSLVTYLYAHVPFCLRKCEYCAFVTHVGSLKLLEPYVGALALEAAELARTRPGGPLETVYFGGGTPSLLPSACVEKILSSLDRIFGVRTDCEITLEAHPDTVNLQKLRDFRLAGVTRISFGGESLNQHELEQLGRGHSGGRVLEVIELARQAGFHSVNIDFMYGIPGQTLATWNETLGTALAHKPDHLSLYPLSIEPRTVFARKWKRNSLQVPGDDMVAAMYALACETLRDAGYEHYEVANWALPGHRCRHNLAYWYNREFYALGVGAHGYLKPYRTENISQTRRYIERVLGGESPMRTKEHVDAATEFSETVMLRLRLLLDGLCLEEIRQQFGVDLADCFADDLVELTARGLLRQSAGRLWLVEEAVPVANEVWQRFLL